MVAQISFFAVWVLMLTLAGGVVLAQDLAGRFLPFQTLPGVEFTSGGEHFNINGTDYLAIANWRDGGTNHDINSEILRWNGTVFEHVQFIATHAAFKCSPFVIDGEQYIVFANQRKSDLDYTINSEVFHWNGTNFVSHQLIPTIGAFDWEFFVIDGMPYLVVANAGGTGDSTQNSEVFQWSGTLFVSIQLILTHGAHDWEAFSINGTHYLAVANYVTNGLDYTINSEVFHWNGINFVSHQLIPTIGAYDWEFFVIKSQYYLAIANAYDGTNGQLYSEIFRWNGASFISFQKILTVNACDLEFFVINGIPYLAIVNAWDGASYNLYSNIYRWNGAKFELTYLLPTDGATESAFFIINQTHYLLVLNNNVPEVYRFAEPTPISISNCTELQNMNNNLAGSYELLADVDCFETVNWHAGEGFEPIGMVGAAFTGTFNGRDYIIANLTINRPAEYRVGMFGLTSGFARIMNVRLKQLSVIGGAFYTAGVAADAIDTQIMTSYVTGVVSGGDYVGSIVGIGRSALVTGCFYEGALTASSSVQGTGGLAGVFVQHSHVERSYALGSVSVTGNRGGGLIGRLGSGSGGLGKVFDCYAQSSVTGASWVGGLIGEILNADSFVDNVYSTGVVSGSSNLGGLIGLNPDSATVTQSHWDTQTSGRSSSAGGIGGVTSTKQQQTTYSGWDFIDTWWIEEGSDYPILRTNSPPVLSQTLIDQIIPSGTDYAFTVPGTTFEDLSEQGLTYTAMLAGSMPLPAWLTFFPNNHTFTGFPENSDAGDYGVRITACNRHRLCTTDEFILRVRDITFISNCTSLQAMQTDLFGAYQLTNDIDCSDTVNWNSGAGFVPVGTDGARFVGLFDGEGYNITGLFISRGGTNGVGLFGYIDAPALINDVGLEQVDITGNQHVGTLIGRQEGGTVQNSHAVTGTVSSNDINVGGLVGWMGGEVLSCYASLTVAGPQRVGGIVGYNAIAGFIYQSYSTSIVIGGGHAGGLVGWHGGLSIIEQSYADAAVSGSSAVGGLVGRSNGQIINSFSLSSVSGSSDVGGLLGLYDSTENKIYYSYAVGPVSGGSPIGGLIGRISAGGTVTRSYWDTQTTGHPSSPGGFSKNTLEMFQQNTFVDWDFSSVWWINNGTNYPQLREFVTLELVNPVPDQMAFISDAFLLLVSANTFFEEDGRAVNYIATSSPSGPLPAWLSFDNVTVTFSGTPPPGAQSMYPVRLTACNTIEDCVTDAFEINVPNRAPIVQTPLTAQRFNAEEPFTWPVPSGTFIELDSDPLRYRALQQDGSPLPNWMSFNNETQVLSGTIPVSQTQPLFITITVHDPFDTQANSTFELSVNHVPIAQGVIDTQSATVGNPYLLVFPNTLFDDSDGDPLTYNATQSNASPLPAWLAFDSSSRTFIGTPTSADKGFLFILLTAFDPHGGSGTVNFAMTISDFVNNNPPLLAIAIPDQTTPTNAVWTFTLPAGTFIDPDLGDTLTYIATLEGAVPLPTWLTFDPDTQTFSGAVIQIEVLRLTIRVEDGNGGFALDTFTLTAEDLTNQPPVLVNQLPNHNVNVDSRFSYTVPADTFFDPNGDELIYTASQNNDKPLPGWLTFDAPTRTFSGKPSSTDTGTYKDRTHTISLCVSDSEGTVCSSFLLTVVGESQTEEAITALLIVGSIASGAFGIYRYGAFLWNMLLGKVYMKPTKTVRVGESFEHQFSCTSKKVLKVRAFDEKGRLLRDEALLPTGVNFERSTMTVSGALTVPGKYLVCAIADDGRYLEAFYLETPGAGAGKEHMEMDTFSQTSLI